jgi:hypothetical protein
VAAVEKILVVGGGIGGLSLAAALRLQGFAPDLVERSPEWRVTGTGLGVLANGMRMFRAIGAADAVAETGAILRRWTYCDARGEVLCATDLAALWGEVGPCVGVERPHLHDALLAAADVTARLGIGPVGMTNDGTREPSSSSTTVPAATTTSSSAPTASGRWCGTSRLEDHCRATPVRSSGAASSRSVPADWRT